MMILKKRFIILSIFLTGFFSLNNLESQSLKYNIETLSDFNQNAYSKFIDSKFKCKEQKIVGDDFEERIIYLGKMKLKGMQTMYILTSHKSIKAASVKHGQSKILFLNTDKELINHYSLDIPEELPYKISRNILFFHRYNEDYDKIGKTRVKIEDELPEVICIGPDGCFYRQ
jgi:hypothetical protein